jgi:hypothetical protein
MNASPTNSATPSTDAAAPIAIEDRPQGTAGLTAAAGLVKLGAVAAAIAIFFALHYAIGSAAGWVGFLFLFNWGGMEQMKFEKLPNCIVGALVGLLTAYGQQALPHLLGPLGFALIIGVIGALVYCLLMGWWRIAVNNSAMLFLTVGTIPAIQAGTSILNLLPALAIGVVYFAALAWVVRALTRRSARKQHS